MRREDPAYDALRKQHEAAQNAPFEKTPVSVWDKFKENVRNVTDIFKEGGLSRMVDKTKQKIQNVEWLDFFRSEAEKERREEEGYEELVRTGRADFKGSVDVDMNEHKNPDSPYHQKEHLIHSDFKRAKRTYMKSGNFDTHYVRVVGVYNKYGKFTGKMKVYKIHRNQN